MSRLIVHSPGVHTGGGFVLLKALLSALHLPSVLNLDIRCLKLLQTPLDAAVNWCAPTIFGRLGSEIRLRFTASPKDVVLCFHGLPPLLPSSARVVVFIQNCLNLCAHDSMTGKSSSRSAMKRLFFRALAGNADEFIVQTPSMRLALQRCLGSSVPVKVIPFLDTTVSDADAVSVPRKKDYDFIYVADGVAHKNHATLLDAWILLAKQDLRPSLLLTLGKRDQLLIDKIDRAVRAHDLNIKNVGAVSREQVFDLYCRSEALIFPSTAESFGIPLIEATSFGLPVIASEKDFVRDVCVPLETFDPASAVSISRAVRRFLGRPLPPEKLRSVAEFVDELLV